MHCDRLDLRTNRLLIVQLGRVAVKVGLLAHILSRAIMALGLTMLRAEVLRAELAVTDDAHHTIGATAGRVRALVLLGRSSG